MSNYPGWDYLLDVMEKEAGKKLADLAVLQKMLDRGIPEEEIMKKIMIKSNRMTNKGYDLQKIQESGEDFPWVKQLLNKTIAERDALNGLLRTPEGGLASRIAEAPSFGSGSTDLAWIFRKKLRAGVVDPPRMDGNGRWDKENM